MNISSDSMNGVLTELQRIKWLLKAGDSTESMNTVISELQTIKWLLVILVVVILFFAVFFFMVLKKMQDPNGLFSKLHINKKLQVELEELLAKGNANEVKILASNWVHRQPGEPYAHWFLAKAYFQAGELVDSKKSFTHLLTISPDWEKVVVPWLERIENEITPKIVK